MRSSPLSSFDAPGQGSGLAVARAVSSATLAAWAVIALELAAVGAATRREIASIWELQFGALWLAPTALALAVPFAAVGAGLLAALRLPERRARAILAASVAALAAVTAFGV